MSSYDQHPRQANRPSSTGERRRREPERGRGARVTGLRSYGEARHPHRARRSEPGKPSKSERAFTVSCGRNSGSSSPAGRRIWSDNGQGGGVVNIYPAAHPMFFNMPFPLAVGMLYVFFHTSKHKIYCLSIFSPSISSMKIYSDVSKPFFSL